VERVALRVLRQRVGHPPRASLSLPNLAYVPSPAPAFESATAAGVPRRPISGTPFGRLGFGPGTNRRSGRSVIVTLKSGRLWISSIDFRSAARFGSGSHPQSSGQAALHGLRQRARTRHRGRSAETHSVRAASASQIVAGIRAAIACFPVPLNVTGALSALQDVPHVSLPSGRSGTRRIWSEIIVIEDGVVCHKRIDGLNVNPPFSRHLPREN
jgi:hypothetical protein